MEPGTGTVDDLACLSELNDNIILQDLRLRYANNVIYTYIGDILVSVNPFKELSIYDVETTEQYKNIQVRSQLKPHIFAIAEHAYSQLLHTDTNQCCVVSGESGAGKTEATKLLVKHIIQLCRHGQSNLHDKIVQVNPLLEAFGNAQTVMNQNSSRFGKFIEIKFTQDGQVVGGKINEYLLEKSRVVRQGTGEKNFHIFYYMFAGLPESKLRDLMLNKPENHRFLSRERAPIYENDDVFTYYKNMLKHLRYLMTVIGFSQEEEDMLYALLAAILHTGDIEFEKDNDTDGVYINNEYTLDLVAGLLDVNPEELISALISNSSTVRGETIVSLKNLDQANDGRDALAKTLYARLFGWIVRQVNVLLEPEDPYYRSHACPQIGLLDIAGFENFQQNSFEQLCINVTNEQLQYYFNQNIFAWEMDEYRKEGINGSEIVFTNNKPLLDMFLQKPLGLFDLVNEESRFPQAGDTSLLDKLNKHFGQNPHFLTAKQSKSRDPLVFTIVHYAGQVTYSVKSFLEKNKDTLSSSVIDCMKESQSQIICDLFTANISSTGTLILNKNRPVRRKKSVLQCKAPRNFSESLSRKTTLRIKEKMKRAAQITKATSNNQRTVGDQFQNSLVELMGKLLEADPQFIRCIKPNHYKQPDHFNSELVLQQLRYTGVLETAKIRRLGFSTRLPLAKFIQRYKVLAFPMSARIEPTSENCYKILTSARVHGWEIGKSKVFLKYYHTEHLNLLLEREKARVEVVQKMVRGFLARKSAKTLRLSMNEQKVETKKLFQSVAQKSNDIFRFMINQKEYDYSRHKQLMKDRIKAEEIKKREEIERQKKEEIVRQKKEEIGRQKRLRIEEEEKKRAEKRLAEALVSGAAKRNLGQGQGHSNGFSVAPHNGDHRVAPPVQKHYDNWDMESIADNNTSQNVPDLIRVKQKKGNNNYIVHQVYNPALQPVKGKRRTPATDVTSRQYEYDTMQSSARPPSEVAYAESSHYARRMSQTPGGAVDNFYEDMIQDALSKCYDVEEDIWAKIYYMERYQRIGKCYVRDTRILIDGSDQEYDGIRLGIGAFKNPFRDEKVTKIREHIGKGLVLELMRDGSIMANREGRNDIIVKGYSNPAHHSLSEDVIKARGRLPLNIPIKVFDMKEFNSHIALEIQSGRPNVENLFPQLITSISFVKDSIDDVETPCWISVFNFKALQVLQDRDIVKKVQKGIAQMALEKRRQVVEDSRSPPKTAEDNRKWAKKYQHGGMIKKEDPMRRSRIELRKNNISLRDSGINYSWEEDSPSRLMMQEHSEDQFEEQDDFMYTNLGNVSAISAVNSPKKSWAKLDKLVKTKESKDGLGKR